MLRFSGRSGDGGLLGWRFFRSLATISPDLLLGLACKQKHSFVWFNNIFIRFVRGIARHESSDLLQIKFWIDDEKVVRRLFISYTTNQLIYSGISRLQAFSSNIRGLWIKCPINGFTLNIKYIVKFVYSIENSAIYQRLFSHERRRICLFYAHILMRDILKTPHAFKDLDERIRLS